MPGSTSLLADLGQWVPRRGTATRPVQMRMADANGPHDPSAPAPTGRPAPTMMAAGVAGSSASGRVMRTTALANGSESPTSRPTMKCETTSVRLPPTIATRTSPHAPRSASRRPGALEFRERRRDRATPCRCGQRPAPSAERLVAQGADPAGEEVGRGVHIDRDAEAEGVVVLPVPQRGRPARDSDAAIPATRTVVTRRWRRLRRAVTRVKPCAEPRFSSVTLGVSTVGPSP